MKTEDWNGVITQSRWVKWLNKKFRSRMSGFRDHTLSYTAMSPPVLNEKRKDEQLNGTEALPEAAGHQFQLRR